MAPFGILAVAAALPYQSDAKNSGLCSGRSAQPDDRLERAGLSVAAAPINTCSLRPPGR